MPKTHARAADMLRVGLGVFERMGGRPEVGARGASLGAGGGGTTEDASAAGREDEVEGGGVTSTGEPRATDKT
jgi:hypothetical protein